MIPTITSRQAVQDSMSNSSVSNLPVSQIAAAFSANNQGVYVNSNQVIELFPLPDTFVWQISNPAGGSAATVVCYGFNEDTYNATPAENGVGFPIVDFYGDGFEGRSYNKLIASSKSARGVKFDGFNIQFNNIATGNSDSAALTTANFAILAYNGTGGNSIPVNINLGRAARNTQYVSGLLTISQDMWLNCTNQIQVTVPRGDEMSLTLMVSADQK